MRFCREIGVEHPDFLELDCVQWADWIAFHELEPFGESWKQTGQVAAAVHNAVLTLGRLTGVLDEETLQKLWRQAAHFMPQRRKRKRRRQPQTWEEQEMHLRLLLRC